MDKKFLLIVNPIAGKRKAETILPTVLKKLDDADVEYEICYTEIEKNATAITLERGKDKDVIICCGGDGTLKETICGVNELGINAKIGYIPLGTTNDFAHSLNIPTDAEKATDAILSGDETVVDIGDFNGTEQFIYVSCFGNFCDVSYKAKQSLKNKIGRGAYYWETVKEIGKIKGVNAKIECEDGEIIEGNFFYGGVSNAYSIAGFPVLSDAGVEFDDGLHELALIKMPKNPAELASIVKTMFITKDVLNNEYIIVRRGTNFKFSFEDEVAWTLDGENGGKHKFAEISTKKHAAVILVKNH